MKPTLIAIFVALSLFNLFADEGPKAKLWGDFQDPRQTLSLYSWIEDGSDVDPVRSINHSILIICWMPDPEGKFETYQISGIDGYHSRKRTEAFLDAIYELKQPKEVGGKRLNVLVAGNNWGAGHSLKEKLRKLSKEHKFSVFYAGGWAFRKAILIEEPEARLKMIKEAFKVATNSEQ